MNLKAQQTLGFILVALLLLAGGWLLIRFFVLFGEANPTVQASIIAGVAALGTVLFTFWKERSRSLKEAHRDKKIEAYAKFYDIIFDVLSKVKKNEEFDMDAPDFQEKFSSIMREVMFYGSPGVIIAFSNMKTMSNLSTDGITDNLHTLKVIGKIFLEMRSDIGLSNRGLDEINIHQIYVSDDLKALGAKK